MKKAYISVDFEGLEDVVSSISAIRSGADFGVARKRLARSVNAAARACFDGGYGGVTACDGHADMENLIIEDLDPRIELISGGMRSSLQMEGIHEGYSVYISFGHAGANLNADGVLNHLYNGRKIYGMRLNGKTMNTETIVNATIAAHYNIPLIAIIGDSAVCREVKEFIPNVEGIEVKRGFSRYSAISVHPEVAEKRIYEGVKSALNRASEIKPLSLGPTIEMEIDFKDSGCADTACLIPGVKRIAPATIGYKGDAETVFKLQNLIIYRLVDTAS